MPYSGPLLTALSAAKRMLRDCHQWRNITGQEWNEATAEDHIYFDALPKATPGPDHSKEQLINLRPFCIMWADIAGGLRLVGDTSGYTCPLPSGTIIMQLELPVPDSLADDPSALAADLSTKLGRILQTTDADEPGLFELSGLAGYLPIKQLQLSGYVRTDAKAAHQLGDAIVAEIQIDWGLQ